MGLRLKHGLIKVLEALVSIGLIGERRDIFLSTSHCVHYDSIITTSVPHGNFAFCADIRQVININYLFNYLIRRIVLGRDAEGIHVKGKLS